MPKKLSSHTFHKTRFYTLRDSAVQSQPLPRGAASGTLSSCALEHITQTIHNSVRMSSGAVLCEYRDSYVHRLCFWLMGGLIARFATASARSPTRCFVLGI